MARRISFLLVRTRSDAIFRHMGRARRETGPGPEAQSLATVPLPALDALSLAAIALDLNAHAGRRLAGVRQPDPQTIVLGLHEGRRTQDVFCSIHPQAARVHLGAPHVPGERLGSFGLLLRSRLVDARLTGVEQPPFERILYLELETLDGPHTLVAEVMGRYSNLILVRGAGASGVVVGALKVVTEHMSRRSVTPGRPYRLPPADRPHLGAIEVETLAPLLTGERPVWRVLAQGVLGLGPVLAHEAALRAGVDPDVPAADAAAVAPAIARAIKALAGAFRAAQFAPTLYLRDGHPAAFAALPLRVYAALEPAPVETMSEAVRRYYEAAAGSTVIEERRRALAASAAAGLRQTERALEANRAALAESQAAERFRIFGELLLTYGREVSPGAASASVPDHTAAGAAVEIPLDPALGPVENAQRYFRRYAKARAAAAAIPSRIATLEAAGLALREALVQIETASTADDLYEVHTDLVARRLVRRPPRTRPASRSGPRRFDGPDGAVIIAGRSSRENDHVTFHVAAPDDLWLHARAIPGAHVVLKTPGTPSEAAMTAAAQVAAYYSEGRRAAQVAVDVVPRRQVRKARGAAPGAVTYEGERTLRVSPALPPPGPR
jgi:predicted ribosome quality control (RQC) complex YloA/Tae2 family protein